MYLPKTQKNDFESTVLESVDRYRLLCNKVSQLNLHDYVMDFDENTDINNDESFKKLFNEIYPQVSDQKNAKDFLRLVLTTLKQRLLKDIQNTEDNKNVIAPLHHWKYCAIVYIYSILKDNSCFKKWLIEYNKSPITKLPTLPFEVVELCCNQLFFVQISKKMKSYMHKYSVTDLITKLIKLMISNMSHYNQKYDFQISIEDYFKRPKFWTYEFTEEEEKYFRDYYTLPTTSNTINNSRARQAKRNRMVDRLSEECKVKLVPLDLDKIMTRNSYAAKRQPLHEEVLCTPDVAEIIAPSKCITQPSSPEIINISDEDSDDQFESNDQEDAELDEKVHGLIEGVVIQMADNIVEIGSPEKEADEMAQAIESDGIPQIEIDPLTDFEPVSPSAEMIADNSRKDSVENETESTFPQDENQKVEKPEESSPVGNEDPPAEKDQVDVVAASVDIDEPERDKPIDEDNLSVEKKNVEVAAKAEDVDQSEENDPVGEADKSTENTPVDEGDNPAESNPVDEGDESKEDGPIDEDNSPAEETRVDVTAANVDEADKSKENVPVDADDSPAEETKVDVTAANVDCNANEKQIDYECPLSKEVNNTVAFNGNITKSIEKPESPSSTCQHDSQIQIPHDTNNLEDKINESGAEKKNLKRKAVKLKEEVPELDPEPAEETFSETELETAEAEDAEEAKEVEDEETDGAGEPEMKRPKLTEIENKSNEEVDNQCENTEEENVNMNDSRSVNEILTKVKSKRNRKFCDVATLIVGGEKIFVVRPSIMSAFSPVFAEIFYHIMPNTVDIRLELPDIDPNLMFQYLNYLYTNIVDNIEKIGCELWELAQKYQFDELKSFCEESLNYININSHNVIKLLLIADSISNESVIINAIEFIRINVKELVETDDFYSMEKSHPHLLSRIFHYIVDNS